MSEKDNPAAEKLTEMFAFLILSVLAVPAVVSAAIGLYGFLVWVLE